MYDKFFYLYLIYIGTLEKTTFKKKNSDFSKNVDIKSITNGRYFISVHKFKLQLKI